MLSSLSLSLSLSHTHTLSHIHTHIHDKHNAEPPDAAVNLTVVSFGARWVNINWIIPFNGNRAVNGVYISDYSLGIIYEQILQNSSEITDASYNISQLLPFTNYTFGVVLCNEIGCSERSNMSGAITTLNDSKLKYRSVYNNY